MAFGLIHNILSKVSSFLFPERCLGCKKSGTLICKECLKAAKKTKREKNSLPHLDRLLSYGFYHDKLLKSALRRLKYHGIYGLSHPMSHMLHDIIRPHLSSLDNDSIILPIPASSSRMRERGYNQAELLANSLSEKIRFPCCSDVLTKSRPTKSQIELSGLERIENIKNSFAVISKEKIFGKDILLVDDISTTGATLSEAARVLKEAGAKKVVGLVVAR